MKLTIILLSLLLICLKAVAQNDDCYKRLLERGTEEFNKHDFTKAILKWQTAKDCPEITTKEKSILNELITKANKEQKIFANNSSKASKNIAKRDTIYISKKVYVDKLVEKIVYVDKPVEKIVYVDKPVEKIVYVDKPIEKIVYVDKPIEKIVYVDKPIERIVYVDKPERDHEFGKGNGKIFIYTTCSKNGTTKVWIDGEYAGSFNVYHKSYVDCNSTGGVSKIVLSGKHHIQTKDDANAATDFYVTIHEDACLPQAISCSQ